MKIRFCSPVRSHMGYAELGRIIINQLVQAGHDVGVVEIPVQTSDTDFGALGAQAIALLDRHASAEFNIVNMIPPLFERYMLPGARNIGYTMFESDSLPAEWVDRCNRMDAIWVPAIWVREMFIASGVRVPVSVVGIEALAPIAAQVPIDGPFRMLSVFQWSARKNPVGLLRAFCSAFDGDASVVLTLKTHRTGDPANNAAFVRNAIGYTLARMKPRRFLPKVEVATDFFSSQQMRELHASSHVLASLAHAEGWGLPAWEASLAGMPVVHTDWSAPTEFVHPQGLVRCSLSPVFGMEDFVPYYDIGMRWAEPHLDHAITLMRASRDDFAGWRSRAQIHREDLLERYSPAARQAALDAALQAAVAPGQNPGS
ncbi:hypothetical protein BH11PSE14_BH11PSE14_17120 [soil metagenome]